MKHCRIILWMCLLAGLVACKDEDKIAFDVPVEFAKSLEFVPAPGGAIMRYKLTDNEDIYGVRVRYTNAWGEDVIKEASCFADSLLLDGFTEALTAVPAQVSLFNRQMEETERKEVVFDTEKSATLAVFDHLTVNSFWGGFNVTYQTPKTVDGIIHVFYIGENPKTHEPDSILMSSVPIIEGGDTLNFVMKQAMDSVEVVVRTDNNRGERVKQMLKTVPCLSMDTLTPEDFDFAFTGKIVEDASYRLGKDYLFDGDKNGVAWKNSLTDGNRYRYSTFLAGPNAFGERFILDLKEERIPAAVNLYAYVYFGGDDNFYKNENHPKVKTWWSDHYYSRLPCEVYLYGTNEDPRTVNLDKCVCLCAFDYSESYDYFDDSWATYTDVYGQANCDRWGLGSDGYRTASDKEVKNADPVVLSLQCNYTGAKYRYLFFVVEDTFCSNRWSDPFWEENPVEYVTFNELEVCIKAE